MDVVYHIGAHCTDDGELRTALVRNRERLAAEGIVVPYAAKYRTLLRDAIHSLQGAPASGDMQEALLDAMTEQDRIDRLVLSNENFIAGGNRALGAGAFYPMAFEKSRWFRNLFPDAGCEFHVAIRNPAAFVPALFGRLRDIDYDDFIAGTDPLALRWSDFVIQLRDANPDARITVWCDEDAPLVWPEVLRAVAGVGPEVELAGTSDRLASVLSAPGLRKLEDYLVASPPETVEHRRRIVAAFLDKYALEDEMEEELDLPGWTHDYVEALTDAYEEDTAEIARLHGVTFIAA